MKPVWLLCALLPFAPFAVAVVAYAPLNDPAVVSLAGDWGAVDAAVVDVDVAALGPADASLSVRLPGRLPTELGRPLLIRSFVLDAGNIGEHHGLVFGGVSNGVAEVWVNGAWVGGEGVASTGYKLGHVALNLYSIDRRHLRAGQNTVVVAVVAEHAAARPRINTVDLRLLVGPVSLVRPWFDRVWLLAALLEIGGVAVLGFVAVLVLLLSRAERDVAGRGIQRAVAALSLAIVGYLGAKSGLILAFDLDRSVITLSITAIAWAMIELIDRAVLGRVTLFQRVNRAICAAHFIAQFFIFHELMYRAFIPYLFSLVIYGAVVSVRGAWRQPTPSTILLAATVTAMAVAGVNDLCTDLHLLATPRLFTLAAVDMGLVGAMVVVGRFLRAMADNTALLTNVEEKNRDLLLALDRAEESTRMKSAFLANTSHELRTPLNSIINVPEGLLEEFVQRPFVVCASCQALFEAPEGYRPDEDCPQCGSKGTLATELRAVFAGDADDAMHYLKAIQQSGRHLLAVVSDILDFSKIEAGRMQVHLEPVVLDDVLEKLALAMGPLAEGRSIDLVVERCCDNDGGTPRPTTTLPADPIKLTQVLMNLVSNAVKFSPEGSEVRVTARVKTRVGGGDDDVIVLSVIDHGIGISAADSARIFQSFVQVDNSHTRRVGGTGLGLAISKNLVELMGGSLAVRSVVGQGSTFVATFPQHAPASVPSGDATAPKEHLDNAARR